jgi:myxalamid-type polyketide synthase MxaE and MxaD
MNTQHQSELIAIVSMACRYPQANTAKEFWELMLNGIDTVTEVPKSRWDMDSFYHPDKSAPNKSHSKHGAFLNQLDEFDPLFFNISPREAQDMRPEQKMMLELTWQAVERAQIPYSEFEGSHTGVYTGVIWDDFEHVRRQKNAPVSQHSALGQSPNVIAGRVSYFFGLTGPSLNVDTGCSASLVAMQIACQGLKDGSIDMAVVGGLNVILDPGVHVLMSKFGGLSAAGRCFTFDERGDGFVRGEGGAVFLLKRLSQAQKDGNKILAIVKSIAVNNNGFNENLPATSAKGQYQMLKMAYQEAKINPAEVQFVETHGTGTKVGDPNETLALGEFFGVNRSPSKPLRIGSVKTIIGHQEGGAAAAGLAKMILAMEHKTFPANLHFVNPNPLIDFEGLKLKVQVQNEPWEVEPGKPRVAGVNSFGWVGTNAHVVIEENLLPRAIEPYSIEREFFVLPISAKTESALRTYVKSYYHHLKEQCPDTRQGLYKICASAALLKPHFEYRTAFVASNKTEMLSEMEEFLSNSYTPLDPIRIKEGRKVVFVFPGQGSQRVGMGKTLYQSEPVFRQTINEFDAAYRPLTGWSLVDEIFADETRSRLNQIDVIQPVIAAVQCALAKMMIHRGVKPDTVLGHSMGEVAAAYVAGVLHIDEAAKIICFRSQLMKTQSGKGAMALTELSYNEAQTLCQNYPNRVSVAVSNSPKSTVLAGDTQDILEIIALLEQKGLFVRRVNVEVASHSPQMEPLMEPLRNLIAQIAPQNSSLGYFSPVLDRWVEGSELSAEYWVQNLRQPVQFSSAISKLLDEKHILFIEISSNPILTTSIDQCLEPHHDEVVIIDTLRKETNEVLESTRDLADFYVQGCKVDWRSIYGRFNDYVDLPSYPWKKAIYALEDNSQTTQSSVSKETPILGRKLNLAAMAGLSIWESLVSLQDFPFFQGHIVAGQMVLPGAAYLEALVELGSKEYASFSARNISLRQAVLLNENQQLQTKVSEDRGRLLVEFFNCDKKFPDWKLVAEAQLERNTLNKLPEPLPLAGMLYRFGLSYSSKSFYDRLEQIGLTYKDQFACIEEVYSFENQALSKIRPSEGLRKSLLAFHLHPAVLDMALQTGFALLDIEKSHKNTTAVVESVGQLICYQRLEPQDEFFAHCIKNGDRFKVTLLGKNGKLYAEVIDLVLALIDKEMLLKQTSVGIKDWLFTTAWMPREKAQKISSRQKVVASTQKWLVLGSKTEPLVHYFRENNLSVFWVESAQDYHFNPNSLFGTLNPADDRHFSQLFEDLSALGWADLGGIVHGFALETCLPTESDLPVSYILERQELGTLSLMALAKTLKKTGLAPMVKILTYMAQAVGEGFSAASLNISDFPLWAMSRTFANEFPELECRRFDVDGNTDWRELGNELLYGDLKEKEVAFRGKNQFVSRLVNYYPQVPYLKDDAEFDPQAVYLITGFRGLASIFAQWMYQRGARNFVFTSRSGKASQKVEAMIALWQSQGAKVEVVQADVANSSGVDLVFEAIAQTGLPLKGIIHAAGLAEAGLLAELERSDFDRITAPKIPATWLLHQRSLAHPIDWFVLFSSPTIFFGTNGQGHYVAGNMFLDAVAEYRQLAGLPALSVNWGLVTELGMAADIQDIDRYARQEGFVPILMAEAVEVFGKVFHPKFVHIGILKLDIEQLKTYYPVWSQSNYLTEVSSQSTQQGEETDILVVLENLKSPQEKKAALEELLKSKLSKLLKIQPIDLKPNMNFKSLGVDSLTAVQFRTQLEKSLKIKLPITSIWSHPNISQYASFLFEELYRSEKQDSSEKQHIWWVVNQPKPQAQRRLICFHGAGQSAAMFLAWNERIGDQIEIVALEIPERANGTSSRFQTVEELLDGFMPTLTPFLDKPFAFFGHSFGGLLAFETLKRLSETSSHKPEHFFVSASLPPFLVEAKRTDVIAALAEDNLGKHFPELIEIADQELQAHTVNLLKADFKLIEAYYYDPYPLFNVPVTAFAAKRDLLISSSDVNEWYRMTAKKFVFHELDENHNFIDANPEVVIEVVKSDWI